MNRRLMLINGNQMNDVDPDLSLTSDEISLAEILWRSGRQGDPLTDMENQLCNRRCFQKPKFCIIKIKDESLKLYRLLCWLYLRIFYVGRLW